MGEAGERLLDFLNRAALDGHTVTPLGVAGSILSARSLRLEDALADVGPSGRGLVTTGSDASLGLRRLVAAEKVIASAVRVRAAAGTLAVVSGPASPERDDAARSSGGSRPALLDDAERPDVETVAAFFQDCSDDETAVLTGDPDELGSVGAGRAFADIAESGIVATRSAAVAATSVLEELAAAIRAGQFPSVDDPSRQVVVVNVVSMEEAVHRVGQLVGSSIPRAFELPPDAIQILTVTETSGLELRIADGGPPPLTVSRAVGHRYPAVVLVLDPMSSGVLTRQLVSSAVRRAERHLSIVNATGGALADAVRLRLARPRRTLLPALLATQLSSGSHSRSSSSDSSSESSESSASSRPSTGPNGVTSSNPENSASS